jgi:hypothetical protein
LVVHRPNSSYLRTSNSIKGFVLWFASFLLGTAVFAYATDWRIILPTNTSWLMAGDAAQHYLGWAFFRHTPFSQFPLGLNPKLGLDVSSSIVFTDSLPLAALAFKPIALLTSSEVQYFGFWIWCCFVLQAYWALRILRRYIVSPINLLLSSLFFVYSPILIYRIIHDGYGHIALASHFVILAALDFYLDEPRKHKSWIALICVTIVIHAYLVPMVIAIWLASLWVKLRNGLTTRCQTISYLLITLGFSLFTAVLVGYTTLGTRIFVGDSRITPESWNYIFRWQPLSLVDSATSYASGWSSFLYNQQELLGDNEGFSFLGTGVLAVVALFDLTRLLQGLFKHVDVQRLAIFTALIVALGAFFTPSQVFSNLIFMSIVVFVAINLKLAFSNQRYRSLIVATVLLGAYSMTNRPGSGNRTWFEYPLFIGLKSFTETFRTHGRFVWPLYYTLTLAILVVFNKQFSKRLASVVLIACFSIQVIDSRGAISIAHNRFNTEKEWSSPFTDKYWDVLANNYQNVIVYPPLQKDVAGEWISVGEFAARKNLGTNSFYFSRWDVKQYEGPTTELRYDLILNELDPESFYIVNDNDLWDGLVQSPRKVAFMGTLNNKNIIAPLTEATGR